MIAGPAIGLAAVAREASAAPIVSVAAALRPVSSHGIRTTPARAAPSFGREIQGIQYSGDGRWLTTLSTSPRMGSDRVMLFDARTGRRRRVLEPANCVWQWALPHQPIVAIGRIAAPPLASDPPRADLVVDYWNLPGGRLLRRRRSPVLIRYPNAFSDDGRIMECRGDHGGMQLWDTVTGRRIRTLQDENECRRLSYSAARKVLATGVDQEIAVWSFLDWRLLRRLRIDGAVQELAFSPDGRLLAARYHDGEVRVWNTRTWRVVFKQPRPEGVGGLAFSPRGQLLASGMDRAAQVWDLQQPARARRFRTRAFVEAVAFSPSGRTLAAGDLHGRLYRWQVLQERKRR